MLPVPPVSWTIHYDRRLDDAFLAHFLQQGFAASLREYVRHARFPLDLQTRKDPKTKGQHVTLYVGLTAVLNVERRANGKARLTAHGRYTQGPYGWRSTWTDDDRTPTQWSREWPAVEDYLEAVIPMATRQRGMTEGAVQSAVFGHSSEDRVMLDREVVMAFRDTGARRAEQQKAKSALVAVASSMTNSAQIPGVPPASFGGKCDVLALTNDGRLLAVEVKPKNVGSIVWSGLQATMYARLLRRWLEEPVHAGWPTQQEVLQGLLDQRRQLNPSLRGPVQVPANLTVVPVVVLQRGANPEYVKRLKQVQAQAAAATTGEPHVELREASLTGALRPLA